jgi:hypothetical protein
MRGCMWWLMPLIPAAWEVEMEGSQSKRPAQAKSIDSILTTVLQATWEAIGNRMAM